MKLLARSSLRHFTHHPWQLGLALLGIALGVAVVVAVDLSIVSARRAFALSVDAVAGRATHQITGGPDGLADSVYTGVRISAGIHTAAPIVEGIVRIATDPSNRTLRLLGIDPFAEAPFRAFAAPAAGDVEPGLLLVNPASLLLSRQLAEEIGIAVGDTFALRAGSEERTAVLAGTLDPGDGPSAQAIADLVLTDIASAQELLQTIGRIDRIDLRLTQEREDEELARVRAVLPPDATIATVASRTQATAAMTRAFELNLTALGLLALVFGTFLIYNSMTFSVVQRRSLIGLLRAQGVTRGEVLRMIVLESLVIGVVATSIGLLIGHFLGTGLVHLVTRTINDLYFRVTVTGVALSPAAFARAALLGVGATVLAALPAAREAASAEPRDALLRSMLEETTHRTALRAGILGAVLLAMGLFALRLPVRSLPLGLAALFVLLFGAALLSPLLTLGLVRVFQPIAARTPLGLASRMAAGGVSRALSRTGPAIAALTVAIAAGTAIAVMIGSFRGSVERWLDATLLADVYIASPSSGANRRDGGIDTAFVQRIRDATGVAGVSTYRNVTIESETGPLQLVIADLFDRHHDAFTFLEGNDERVWSAFEAGAVLISEPLAYRQDLHVGDSLALPSPLGPRRFPVAAVFRDYASEFGIAFIERGTWSDHWDDPGVSSVGVFGDPAVPAAALMDGLRRIDAGTENLLFQPSAALRSSTLRVFDRTFAITAVLRALALLVALVGVLAALLALQLERTRELGVLRATGFTPRQIAALVVAQSAFIGMIAGLLSVPLSFLLSWAMVDVINRRAFGWTMDLRFDTLVFAESLILALAAATIAGLWPAFRAMRIVPAAAIREE
jgi:putative ABC transport system permease protein